MAKMRDRIRMTDAEVAAFLDEESVLLCATNGKDGWPHLAPLDYLVDAGVPSAWTYRASQKVRNLERDPRATISIDAGTAYTELRGVMLTCDVEIRHDDAEVAVFGRALAARRLGIAADDLGVGEIERIEAQAVKRVVLRFHERRRASWDHRKLATAS